MGSTLGILRQVLRVVTAFPYERADLMGGLRSANRPGEVDEGVVERSEGPFRRNVVGEV